MGIGASNAKVHQTLIERLKANTYFTEKELHKWHKRFLRDFPEGAISREEFQNIYKQLFPNGNPQNLSNYLFDVFDKNKDGLVEFEEYMEALSTTSRGTLEEKLQWTFRLYDLDNDGFVTRKELLTLLQTVYEMTENSVNLGEDDIHPEKRLETIMTVMDVSNDKGVTEEEFIRGCKSDSAVVRALSLYDGLV